eukprot:CAMPEP_0180627270 /NCGR_PEP_ID=MMETSP1037_2-20121125/38285_1 /TAXON_ID=632150 /ORGANISM="Azadinium spinosum, Strain 3D9" /LENGTH=143 /DNA_ID=CAMNT_0022647887 /DNA_START=108 /DNA_END=535 /DNA_ORIENTATION=+
MAPESQEFYLFCFFCLGFVIFRTELVRGIIRSGGRKAAKELGVTASSVAGPARQGYSLEQLRTDFAQRQYQRALDGFPRLQRCTAEALSLAARVGLLVAKAVASTAALKPHLVDVVQAVTAAVGDPSPRARVAMALRSLADQA